MKTIRTLKCAVVLLAGAVACGVVAGCGTADDGQDAKEAEGAVAAASVLTEPAANGDETNAILKALHVPVDRALHGQTCFFNYMDPVGRLRVHGDWAYFDGIIEGPNGNQQPIDYKNSDYKTALESQAFDGVQRNGHFAAFVLSLLKRDAHGKWSVATSTYQGHSTPDFAVGPTDVAWAGWTDTVPAAARDVFPYIMAPDGTVAHPPAGLHVPKGDEALVILDALRAPIMSDLHGQVPFFDYTNALAHAKFEVHGNWAYFEGSIVGPNGNQQPIDYQNSEYKEQMTNGDLDGLQIGGHFAASVVALLKYDGRWEVATTTFAGGSHPQADFAVGPTGVVWVGWADTVPAASRDIFPTQCIAGFVWCGTAVGCATHC